MLSVPAAVRVFVPREPIDMRKGFDGLTAEVIHTIDHDPPSGHLFLFLNRRRDRVQIFGWTGTGHYISYKRLDKGSFALRDLANGRGKAFEISATAMTLLLEGVDLRGLKQQLIIEENNRDIAGWFR